MQSKRQETKHHGQQVGVVTSSNETRVSRMPDAKAKQIDIVLDDMDASLVRIKSTATETGKELEYHNILIDDVNNDTDETDSRLKQTTKKVRHLIESMPCIPYRTTGCVVILTIIICIMLLLLIFG